jgi:hypothetical protein
MVTDSNVTNVLLICDESYAEKADARKRGVGTESQIISREVYEKVTQSKFIPIVRGFADDGSPFLPAFLKSRIYIDFSTAEKLNENGRTPFRFQGATCCQRSFAARHSNVNILC